MIFNLFLRCLSFRQIPARHLNNGHAGRGIKIFMFVMLNEQVNINERIHGYGVPGAFYVFCLR